MTEPPATGWWQASDGNWYAPEHHPDAHYRARFATGATAPSAQRSASHESATDPATRSRRWVRVGAVAVVVALVVAGAAAAMFGVRPSGPKAALAAALGNLGEPSVTEVRVTGALEYDALPAGDAAQVRADLGPIEEDLRRTVVTVGHEGQRWRVHADVGDVTALAVDLDTVSPPQALQRAEARGASPGQEVRQVVQRTRHVPSRVTMSVDPAGFSSVTDGGISERERRELEPLLRRLVDGETVSVSGLSWATVALVDNLSHDGDYGLGALDSGEVADLATTFTDAFADYYRAHAVVRDVDEPPPPDVADDARAVEMRLPAAPALASFADELLPVIFDAMSEEAGFSENELTDMQRDIREAASSLRSAPQPQHFRAHAWLDDGRLLGAHIPVGYNTATVAEALEIPQSQSRGATAEDIETVADLFAGVTVELTSDPGPIARPRPEADTTYDTPDLVSELASPAELEGLEGMDDYDWLIEVLRRAGDGPPVRDREPSTTSSASNGSGGPTSRDGGAGQEGGSTSPSAAEWSSFRDDAAGFTLSYPATWSRRQTSDPDVRFFAATSDDRDLAGVRITPLDVEAGPGSGVASDDAFREMTERMVRDQARVEEMLVGPETVDFAGGHATYYVYSVEVPGDASRGVQASYFAPREDRLITLRLQTASAARFSESSSMFDRVADSFRVLPSGDLGS